MTQNRFVCEWVTKGCEKIENQKFFSAQVFSSFSFYLSASKNFEKHS